MLQFFKKESFNRQKMNEHGCEYRSLGSYMNDTAVKHGSVTCAALGCQSRYIHMIIHSGGQQRQVCCTRLSESLYTYGDT